MGNDVLDMHPYFLRTLWNKRWKCREHKQKIDDTSNELISFKYDSNGPGKVIDVVLNGIAD